MLQLTVIHSWEHSTRCYWGRWVTIVITVCGYFWCSSSIARTHQNPLDNPISTCGCVCVSHHIIKKNSILFAFMWTCVCVCVRLFMWSWDNNIIHIHPADDPNPSDRPRFVALHRRARFCCIIYEKDNDFDSMCIITIWGRDGLHWGLVEWSVSWQSIKLSKLPLWDNLLFLRRRAWSCHQLYLECSTF